jgi:hypothetical protein
MPTEQIVALLIAERDELSWAIEALQGPAKRRGRPPRNPVTPTAPTVATPQRQKRSRTFTAAQRKAASERMRLRWAAKKKEEAKAAKKA